MQTVNGGQKSHTGSSGVDIYADYNGPTPNPNGHLVFELSPKNRFLTFHNIGSHYLFVWKHSPYLIHYLSQNINCVVPCHWELLVFEYFTIAFWARNWPLKTLGPKTVMKMCPYFIHNFSQYNSQPCQMFWLNVIGKTTKKCTFLPLIDL